MFLLWTAPIGLLLLIIVSFFDGCYKAGQDIYLVGGGDIITLQELYQNICCFVDEALMEELNQRLRRRFQTVSLQSAFLQGYADDLLYQLTWRDPESSKQIFQLLLDILPGDI